MDERTKKNARLGYPAELRKKALLELAESRDTKTVARHYQINKQTFYNRKSGECRQLAKEWNKKT